MAPLSIKQTLLAAASATLALTASTAPSVSRSTSSSIVDLKYARYQGKVNESLGTTSYYSMHFAAPPIGNLRWRAPVPIEKSRMYSGNPLLNATTSGSACVQTTPQWAVDLLAKVADGQLGSPLLQTLLTAGDVGQTQSEDCLRLDIVVPNSPKSSKLPVVVMIHGGEGYVEGSALSVDGNAFVSESNGRVIYVSIQYRLGPYGFLSSSEIRQDGTANAGLLDQRLALEWVQKYISAFGGDPTKVTIWGGSAGGGSVGLQMMLYGGEASPPFRGGIAQFPGWVIFHNNETQEAGYHDLLKLTDCNDLKCLRGVPAAKLANASQDAFAVGYAVGKYGYGDYYFCPTVDGHIVQELPSKAFQSGHFSKIPVLTDREAYEGILFTNFSINNENEVLPDIQAFWPNVDPSSSYFTNLMALYPESNFELLFFLDPIQVLYGALIPESLLNSPFYQRAAVFGDACINCPSYYIANGLANAGVPSWKMRFAAGFEAHGSAAVFTQLNSSTSGSPILAHQLKDYFISFITALDPNAVSTVSKPIWPRYETGSFQILNIEQLSISNETDPDETAGRCAFFQSQNRYSLI
ncbi:Alpha/Beta hydrolase protein [Xylogone sp. PMI_703]|nr:Alpha/Beta hydrolase protein [Xylogone sp. PMI_703]